MSCPNCWIHLRGGAIPLEAQRLGLKAHAHDLNPVAVMINKAMIEIPPRFANLPPVNPDAARRLNMQHWNRAQGLAEDVRYYGEWMKREAFARIGHLYPKVAVPKEQGGGEATVIAWIWARTVKCPNPACGCTTPLVKSFVLSKKKGNEHYIEPVLCGDHFDYIVRKGKHKDESTMTRTGAYCQHCNTFIPLDYIRNEGVNKRFGDDLMAVVAEGNHNRIYISPNDLQRKAATVERPEDYPSGVLSGKTRVSVPLYGMNETSDLFTNRQLTALTTFSDLVSEAQKKAEEDAISHGMPHDGIPLSDGGNGAKAYGEAIGVYFAFVVNKLADYHSSICSWHNSGEKIGHTFGRQAIPMVWDYVEGNPFCNSTGCFNNMLEWIVKCVMEFPATISSEANQEDAQNDCGLRNIVISTDPPYYDNICYADLSDYFYVWLRSSLHKTYPQLFNTMLTPKDEELIASPYRHDGDIDAAKQFFEDGMLKTCKQLYKYAREDIPVTIYYAYKQRDTDDNGNASSGWETMLSSIIKAGFVITATWPMRTEMSSRSVALNSNALASSIVLVCRKRAQDAPNIWKREFIKVLPREMESALEKLQQENHIAPVDLAQAAIGPGMGVYSRYAHVMEVNGKDLSVREVLQMINAEIDRYFNKQGSELDAASRFCVDLFTHCAFRDIKYGDAEVLAKAKNTSIPAMERQKLLFAEAGKMHLLKRDELPKEVDPEENCVWLLTQQLTRAMEKDGNEGCAKILANSNSNTEAARTLAYRLYSISERKGWTDEAFAYNSLVTSWQVITEKASIEQEKAKQLEREKQLDVFTPGDN